MAGASSFPEHLSSCMFAKCASLFANNAHEHKVTERTWGNNPGKSTKQALHLSRVENPRKFAVGSENFCVCFRIAALPKDIRVVLCEPFKNEETLSRFGYCTITGTKH